MLVKRDWTGSGVGELMSVWSSAPASVLVPSPDTVNGIFAGVHMRKIFPHKVRSIQNSKNRWHSANPNVQTQHKPIIPRLVLVG